MRNNTNTDSRPGQPISGHVVLRISWLEIVNITVRIGIWNVRSLFAAGKLYNEEKEVERLKVGIMGIRELR